MTKKEGSSRLYVRARVIGYRRAKHVQKLNTSLLEIEGVNKMEDGSFYIGKRVAYIYHAKTARKTLGKGVSMNVSNPTTKRMIWGKIVQTHGNSGVVRAKFRRNLPPSAHGKRVRVMLYPSNI